MPSILQICVEGNTGSTGRIAEEIGLLALKKGWSSYIAFGRFPRPSTSNLIKIESNLGIFLHGLETRLFDRHALGSRISTKKFIRKIKDIKPDVIHLHHLHGYYINIEILFKFLKEFDVPVIWTFHDCWSFTGHCAYFDFVGCDKWKTECNNCPQRKEYPSSLLFDRSKKNFYLKKELFTSIRNMVVVPVSIWLEGLIKESFMKFLPTQVIHNGIDISLFKPQYNEQAIREKYQIGNCFLILGVASPWTRRKGLNDFLELSKHLQNNEVIVLVGLSPNQLKNLPPNIIGLAKTENRQQLIDLYSSADIFINPTWEDNFPTTNIESLACGTPVITYKTGGSVEAISPDTGFVVEKGDISGVIEAVKHVKCKEKKSYRNDCRKRAVDLFSKDNKFVEYFRLYERLLETKK